MIDPRTKILLMILCVITSMMLPSLEFEGCYVLLIAVFAWMLRKKKYACKGILFYLLIYWFTGWVMGNISGTMRTSFVAFLGLFHKVYPCGFLAGVVLSTTKVNEFLSAMQKVKAPKKIVIPLAVMLRYIPSIQEDSHFIKDAMRMRDVSPNILGFLKHPVLTVECIYVPLMMAASKTSDELSVACITRGIENPKDRTCLIEVKMKWLDVLWIIAFAAVIALALYVRGGGSL